MPTPRSISARDLLEWNGVLPNVRVVQQDGPGIDDKATAFFMVVVDYGWAERILCTGSYQQDAEAIAQAIREACALDHLETELARLRKLERELARLREGLRESALLGHRRQRHPRSFDVCTWFECRTARALLTDTPEDGTA